MKESEITKMSDGTIIRKFVNGFVFEGYADDRDNPISGILTTPEGIKYEIPDFKGEYIYNVFDMIRQGQLKNYIKQDNEPI